MREDKTRSKNYHLNCNLSALRVCLVALKADLRITAIVPPDAISGPITIVTPHGNATTTTSFQVLPPPLTIRLTAANEVEIAWPATSPEFVLEVSEDLSSGLWSAVSQMPLRTNGTSTIKLIGANGSRFYRLRKS
jgi:hypothetical protein